MSWIRPLSAADIVDVSVVGGKAHGLNTLLRLGFPVPDGVVVEVGAWREFRRGGRLPEGLAGELAHAVRKLGSVSVRSGAAVSMPGMMDTVLDLAADEVAGAVERVFASWDSPRARVYRALHDIPDELGTAVVVQRMVHGEAGVAFSRNPDTGEPVVFGEIGRAAEVVAGQGLSRPIDATLAERLRPVLRAAEAHYRDVCHVEFTVAADRLWLLQVRPGGLSGLAAARVAVDLVDEGLIDRRTALTRVAPDRLTPPARVAPGGDVLARGIGASPGVATGRIATTADAAVRMAASGPVILVRPHTSPLDMHGLAAAAGVVTSRGGPTSHAAVVARSMGRPAVVSAAGLLVADDEIRAGARVVSSGEVVTIDGTGGEVLLGAAELRPGDTGPYVARLREWAG